MRVLCAAAVGEAMDYTRNGTMIFITHCTVCRLGSALATIVISEAWTPWRKPFETATSTQANILNTVNDDTETLLDQFNHRSWWFFRKITIKSETECSANVPVGCSAWRHKSSQPERSCSARICLCFSWGRNTQNPPLFCTSRVMLIPSSEKP